MISFGTFGFMIPIGFVASLKVTDSNNLFTILSEESLYTPAALEFLLLLIHPKHALISGSLHVIFPPKCAYPYNQSLFKGYLNRKWVLAPENPPGIPFSFTFIIL